MEGQSHVIHKREERDARRRKRESERRVRDEVLLRKRGEGGGRGRKERQRERREERGQDERKEGRSRPSRRCGTLSTSRKNSIPCRRRRRRHFTVLGCTLCPVGGYRARSGPRVHQRGTFLRWRRRLVPWWRPSGVGSGQLRSSSYACAGCEENACPTRGRRGSPRTISRHRLRLA